MYQVRKKEGISLVALVITIIVLIILTGAVIATFMEGGIIDRAKEAVKRSDYTTLREAYDTNYNVAKIDIETGTGGEISKKNVLEKSVKQVGLEKDFDFTEGIRYIGNNEEIEKWCKTLMIEKETADFILGNGYLVTNKNPKIGDIKAQIGNKYDVYNGNTKIENIEKNIETGNILYLENNRVACIIVIGDVNCDGDIDALDSIRLEKYLINQITLEYDYEKIAADVNEDGYISLEDTIEIEESSARVYLINNRVIDKVPEKVVTNGGKKYEWKEVHEILVSVTKNNAEIEIEDRIIKVDAGKTYEWLKDTLEDSLGVTGVKIYDIYDKNDNEKSSNIIEDGDQPSISIPKYLPNNIYVNVNGDEDYYFTMEIR